MSLFQARGLVPKHPPPHPCVRAHEIDRSLAGIGYAILVQRPANKLSYEGLPILEKEIEPRCRPAPSSSRGPARAAVTPGARARRPRPPPVSAAGSAAGVRTLVPSACRPHPACS